MPVMHSRGRWGARVTSGPFTQTNIASITFTPTITGTALPVTFGHAFKYGDIPVGASIEALGKTTQCDIKSTHADGSARHAIITVLTDTSAGVPILLTLRTRSLVGGTAITKAQILTTVFDASVSLDVGGVVYAMTARELLAGTTTPITNITHISGAYCTEYIVGAALRNGASPHAHLTAYFHVRAYSSAGNGTVNRVRCDVVVENGWSFAAGSTSFTYGATVSVGGATLYTNVTLTQYHHTRWHQVGWWGGDTQVYVQPDTQYLRDSKAVPNYASLTPQESVLNSYTQSIAPMGRANLLVDWSGTGYSPQIGLMPEWYASFVMGGDIRAFKGVLANDSAGGSYSYHYRDENTGLVPSIDTYRTLSEQYPETGLVAGTGGNPNVHDLAHSPLIGYLGYLLTGDYYYLEEVQFLANWGMLWNNYAYRQYELGVLASQNRGQAWGMRSLAAAAAITPDSSSLKSYFTSKVNNNINDRATKWSLPPTNVLGAIQDYAWNPPASYYYSPWQNNFFVASVNWIVDLGFNSTNALSLRNWFNKWPTGLMGQDGSGFCPYYAGVYNFDVGIVDAQNVYRNFLQLYQAQFPVESAQACPTSGLMLNGYPASATGYYSNMQPALAMAVDAGQATQATWAKFASMGTPDYTAAPTWAIVPRAVTPAWYTSLNHQQWTMFAGSNMSAVDPCPARNCSYSAVSGQNGVMNAWGGGAYDTTRDNLIVWGGGHTDYAGNEVYAFGPLTSESPTWQRVVDPSPSVAYDVNYYADGKPSSRHTYNALVYAPNIDKFVAMGGSVFYGTGNFGNNTVLRFDFATNMWSASGTIPGAGGGIATVTAYDPVTGNIWHHSSRDGGGLTKYDPVANTFNLYSSIYLQYYYTMAIDPVGRKLIALGAGLPVRVWDINNPSAAPTTPVTSGDKTIEIAQAPGFVYDPIGLRFIAWAGGATIYALDPVTWAWSVLTNYAGNTVTPTTTNAQGTYGRFRYVPSLHGVVAVNRNTENVYFYKL